MINFDVVDDIPTTNKTVLLLSDLNVPLNEENKIIDDKKIQQAMPTINYLVRTGARVVIATHLGNPISEVDLRFSTKPIAQYLDKRLRCDVKFCPTCVGEKAKKEIFSSEYGDVIVLENLLFDQREKTCDISFAKQISDGMNIYVNDAFEYSNYAYASVLCIPLFVRATAGLVLKNHIQNLDFFLSNSNTFSTAIIGGKMANKMDLLNSLIERVNCIIVGGIIANNFLKALGYEIGHSQFEPMCVEMVDKILKKAKDYNCSFIFPTDVLVSTNTSQDFDAKKIDKIDQHEMIVDLGKESIKNIQNIISLSRKVFFYGNTGISEIRTFSNSTSIILKTIAQSTKNKHIFSIINGNDTILAAKNNGYLNDFSFISEYSNPVMKYFSDKPLPGIEILKRLSCCKE